MSKIGKQPIPLPDGVTALIDDDSILVSYGKDEVRIPRLAGVESVNEDNTLRFRLVHDNKQGRSNWGTQRSLVYNAIQGFIKGFEKQLIVEGVGFRVTKEGEGLVLNLGFSHPVRFPGYPGIALEVDKSTIRVSGSNKELVGQVAAKIRSLRKPEPYKGKGIRYEGEVIRRKAGKKAAGTDA